METRWKVGTVLYNGEGEKVVRTVVGQAREIPGPGRCRGGPDGDASFQVTLFSHTSYS